MPFWKRSPARDTPADTVPLRCSFCNKHQNDVAKLIAGPAVYICDECVTICVEILADDTRFTKPSSSGHDSTQSQGASAPADAPATTDAKQDCVICRAPVAISTGLTIPGRGMLCAECEEAVVLAVDNRWPADE